DSGIDCGSEEVVKRHARPCAGHPRLYNEHRKTWMAGTSPAMTWLGWSNPMEFDNTFEVPLPPAEAWPVLMDIRRIAPCMPGAQLTEVVDDRTYKGNIGVRLGPVALTFAGIVKFEDI